METVAPCDPTMSEVGRAVLWLSAGCVLDVGSSSPHHTLDGLKTTMRRAALPYRKAYEQRIIASSRPREDEQRYWNRS